MASFIGLHYNIPASTTSIPEGCDHHTQGKNTSVNPATNGPMARPKAMQASVLFWILALDSETESLQPGLDMGSCWPRLSRTDWPK